MRKADFKILNKLGLHARPASKLVKLVSTSKCDVNMIKNGQRVNAKSILGVLLLQAEQGSTISVEIEGEDEDKLVEDIQNLINNKFDED